MIGHTLGKSSAAASEAPMPARIEIRFRKLSRNGVAATAALEPLHRSDEPVRQERALDLELVERLRMGRPSRPAASRRSISRARSCASPLRCARMPTASSSASTSSLPLCIRRVTMLSLRRARLGPASRPRSDRSCAASPFLRTGASRETVFGYAPARWDSACTGWARAGPSPSDRPARALGGRLQAREPRQFSSCWTMFRSPVISCADSADPVGSPVPFSRLATEHSRLPSRLPGP